MVLVGRLWLARSHRLVVVLSLVGCGWLALTGCGSFSPVVVWLVLTGCGLQVHLKFKLRHDTLFLTVNILDRFLSSQRVRPPPPPAPPPTHSCKRHSWQDSLALLLTDCLGCGLLPTLHGFVMTPVRTNPARFSQQSRGPTLQRHPLHPTPLTPHPSHSTLTPHAQHQVDLERLQLVGVVSLMIAAKNEEIRPPRVHPPPLL